MVETTLRPVARCEGHARGRGPSGPAAHEQPPRQELAAGGKVIPCASPLNVLKDTYDRSCDCARSDECPHVMASPPAARQDHRRHQRERAAPVPAARVDAWEETDLRGAQGAHLNPLGLLLRTSTPCIWRTIVFWVPP
jgi:hypothetical protein